MDQKIEDIGDNCTHCGKDTSFGSGLFVNRIPSTTETQDGYMCPDCQAVECDGCGEETIEYSFADNGDLLCISCFESNPWAIVPSEVIDLQIMEARGK